MSEPSFYGLTPECSVSPPAGLQHPLPPPGPLPQLRGLRGPRREDPQRRQRVRQLPHPRVPRLAQEAHDRLMEAAQRPQPHQELCVLYMLLQSLSTYVFLPQ